MLQINTIGRIVFIQLSNHRMYGHTLLTKSTDNVIYIYIYRTTPLLLGLNGCVDNYVNELYICVVYKLYTVRSLIPYSCIMIKRYVL